MPCDKIIFHTWLDITNSSIDICEELVSILNICDKLVPIFHLCEDSVPFFHICKHLVLIIHVCENWVPILHRCEELVPILHICENWVPILHILDKSNQSFADSTNTSQIFKVKNEKDVDLSTDVRPLKLSKLTIRKFHIFQKRRFGTNSSHGVKFAKFAVQQSSCKSVHTMHACAYTRMRMCVNSVECASDRRTVYMYHRCALQVQHHSNVKIYHEIFLHISV